MNASAEHEKEDKERLERVEAKNELEGYLYNARNSFQDEKVKEKLGADAKAGEDKAGEEDKETYKGKMKEAEEALRPLLMKLYASKDGAEGGEGSMHSQESQGPRVEEVD